MEHVFIPVTDDPGTRGGFGSRDMAVATIPIPTDALPSWLTSVGSGEFQFSKAGLYVVTCNLYVHIGLNSAEDSFGATRLPFTGAGSGEWTDGAQLRLTQSLHYDNASGGGGLV